MTDTNPKTAAGRRKPAMDKIPPSALIHMGVVMGLGAEKYSPKIEIPVAELANKLAESCTCEAITKRRSAILTEDTQHKDCACPVTKKSTLKLNQPPVIQTGLRMPKDFVASATTWISKELIPNTPKNSRQTTKIGLQKITNAILRVFAPTEKPIELERETGIQTGSERSHLSDSHGKMRNECSQSKAGDAGFVEAPVETSTLTSIMTTKQEKSEGFCVTDVTKDSGFLEMIENLLSEHSLTCHVRKFDISVKDDRAILKRSGAFNWRESPISASVYVAAAMRHLLSWADGDTLDEESGASHLAHVMACCAIALDAQESGALLDDRPGKGSAARLINEFAGKTES